MSSPSAELAQGSKADYREVEKAMNDQKYFAALVAMLGEKKTDIIYPCIQDMLQNGPVPDRFSDSEVKPMRQDITQYLAAWARYAGLGEEECRSWLIEYCVTMLSSISKTSPSGIRHSTKSNIRYIYRSEIPFLCNNEHNAFKAPCSRDCPAYADMTERARRKKEEMLQEKSVLERSPLFVEEQIMSVKETYRDQFEVALKIIRDETEKKTEKKKIVKLLNEQGLKSRTGRKWTYSILTFEQRKLKAKENSDTPPRA